MKSGIYRITIGAGVYYGSAVNLKNREWSHRSDLRNGRHANKRMQNAWNKYHSMQFEVVELCENSKLIEREQVYITQIYGKPHCMNLCPTAGNTLGVKHSEESRRNMSLAHIGKMKGEKHPNFGKPRSEETKEKLRKAQTGKRMSAETAENHRNALRSPAVREKMSLAAKGRKQSAETIEKRISNQRGGKNAKARSIRLVLPSGETRDFDCISDASRELKINRPTLNRWLQGTKKWPGCGRHSWRKNSHLVGLTGNFI